MTTLTPARLDPRRPAEDLGDQVRTAPAQTPRARRSATTVAERRFRPDIEGLRAVAVVAVVVYHVGLGLPGGYVGVDVFLVISGFLISGQLVRTIEAQGLRALPTFYAHRVRRLLPAAAVVVAATVVAFRFLGPPLKVHEVATDAIFTTFYGLNYRLAALGTDYQHMGAAASPLQHFWSLAVEEQFYIVWPLVVALVFALGRRFARWGLLVVVVAVVATSSHASATLTQTSAPWAYFSMHTRAWELGVGALLALATPQLARLPRRLAGLLAYAGLAAIGVSAAIYTAATPFPGTAAWVPVLGAAAVIAAGCGPRVRAERLLGEPAMQCVGRASYSLYLWHWPLIVLAPTVVGHDLTIGERLAVVWISLALAIATFVVVEQPARRATWSSPKLLGSGVLVSGLVAASAVGVMVLAPATVGTGAVTQLAAPASGARPPADAISTAVQAGLRTTAAPRNLTPQPADAADSLPPTSRNGCHAGFTTIEQGACVYGAPKATRTVVLFGDSHAEQWLPALDTLGRKNDWRVVSWTKAACPAGALTVFNPSLNRDYSECDTWRSATISRIGALAPDAVIVSQSENVASSKVAPAAFAAATTQSLQQLRSAAPKARLVYVEDIPTPGTDLPGCVAEHLDDVGACAYDRSDAYRYPDRHTATAEAVRNAKVALVDPAGWLCTTSRCPAVVGNVLVYRNESHITVPYSRWLAPALAPVLTPRKAA